MSKLLPEGSCIVLRYSSPPKRRGFLAFLDKKLVEIDRFFPSSHICPNCLTQQPKMDLSVREWTCINNACNTTHDRDEAASQNIRAEGIRILKADGAAVSEEWRERKTRPTKDLSACTKDQGKAAQARS